MIRTDTLSCPSPLLSFIFKGTLLQEKQKTGFSVLTTIEFNLPVKFTISANDGLRTFNLKKPLITSYELKATSYELRYKV
jgi:hypothetical protein